ncbi:superoxide dismutase family protein [Paracoccus sediminicola]|uniref:superoxide dismutase family protein n=1 Tax=Paracoccus sediminicola TaxID=3017783 RepID=UPI0022F134D1|nr:superoxide dismutase family protein [Paracoccus sediminicola]WBU57663.1 superoxide dismutase family protein [Paracoccus sediminicola]
MHFKSEFYATILAALMASGAAMAQETSSDAATSEVPEEGSMPAETTPEGDTADSGDASGDAAEAADASADGSGDRQDAETENSETESPETEDSGTEGQSTASEATASAEPALSATISDAEGAQVGSVELVFAASGLAVVDISFSGVEPGTHGVHFHETGQCEAPFDSAGDHLAGDMEHGVLNAGGPHPGDLPNITVPESGEISVTYFVPNLTSDLVNDGDGTAFMIHSAADDYRSQPSGDAGDRLGCAVIAEAG